MRGHGEAGTQLNRAISFGSGRDYQDKETDLKGFRMRRETIVESVKSNDAGGVRAEF